MTEKTFEEKIQEFEEKKERMTTELFNTTLKTFDRNTAKVVEKKVSDYLTREDIWFTMEKPRPIIKEEGFNKLVKATGARFPKLVFIERQADFGSVERGQVTVEATVSFEGAEEHERNYTDLGVANVLNSPQLISKAHMPIMALKRARARAFYRSPYINMSVYDETEVSDDISKVYQQALLEKEQAEVELQHKEEHIAQIETQLRDLTVRFKDFYSLVKENIKVGGLTLWEMDNLGKMKAYVDKNKEKLNPLELKLFENRLKELEKEEAKKKQEDEQSTTPEQANPEETKQQEETNEQ